MEKFVANDLLAHNGRVVFEGQELSLTEEQAERLGSKVTPLEVAKPDKPVEEMTLTELRGLAKKAGVESYSRKDKATLKAELSGQVTEPAEPVTPDDVVVVDDVQPSGN